MADFRIGDEVYIHRFVDEVRRDTVIIKNEGGYFGTVADEIMPSAQLVCNTPPSVQPGMWWCDGCITPKHICIHCVRNYPSLSDCYCACKRRERRSDDQDS